MADKYILASQVYTLDIPIKRVRMHRCVVVRTNIHDICQHVLSGASQIESNEAKWRGRRFAIVAV